MKNEIRNKVRKILNMAKAKECYGKMSVYHKINREIYNSLIKSQKKMLTPALIWAWNKLADLSKRYHRKMLQAEKKGDLWLKRSR